MRLPDQVTGLFLAVLGAAANYGGFLLPPVPGQPVGPNVFPLVIGIGLALCGLAIAFGIGRSFEEEEELVPAEQGPAEQALTRERQTGQGQIRESPIEALAARLYGLRALVPPALLLLYVLAADWLGFFITAALMTCATATALGARWKLALPLTALAPVGIYLIFGKLLRVPLPHQFPDVFIDQVYDLIVKEARLVPAFLGGLLHMALGFLPTHAHADPCSILSVKCSTP